MDSLIRRDTSHLNAPVSPAPLLEAALERQSIGSGATSYVSHAT